MAEVLKKKFNIRKILKDVVEKCITEADNITKQDGITEENIEMLNSYQETIKRKINAVKTLEDEILDLEDDPNAMENILSESTRFEINSKAKLASVIKFVAANAMKNESKLEPMYRPNKFTKTEY